MAKKARCPGSGKNLHPPHGAVTVQCPACQNWIRLRKDGRLVVHRVAIGGG